MTDHLDEHVLAALSHLREATNELGVRCLALDQLRAATLAVEAVAESLQCEPGVSEDE